MPAVPPRPCPCGSDDRYDACCGPLHLGARQAATAEQLMRSRYSAYATDDVDYLLRTWHPRTRPDRITPDPSLVWEGLAVTEVVDGGEDDITGIVAFTARYRTPDGAGELTERSRFDRRGTRWVYVDGDVA
ncbi:YchJ family protein [Euzebya rosea]|uniref:YchJ family protein n=1 Tax=Euzebya rosea TaxID=2052804 RepID=UPI000D3EB3E2|nr:YchJ family metal-binding protein [Euzebya rosea]